MEMRPCDRSRCLLWCVTVAVLVLSINGMPLAAAQPSRTVAEPPVDPLLDLCASVSLEELEELTGFRFAMATPTLLGCSYASEIDAEDLFSLDLRVEGGHVSGLEASIPGGRRLEVAGRPAYWAGTALWTDYADGLLTVQPLMLEPDAKLLDLALPVAELALSRIGPPLVDASAAFAFEELEATPAACYGEDQWLDPEGHRISGLPVTLALTVHHLGDTTDQLWFIIEDYDFMGAQPTLITADWARAAWSYPYGTSTLVVPGPQMVGTDDRDLELEIVLRSLMDISYEVRVTAGPPLEPRPDEAMLDAIVRAPALARWERWVSSSFC
jgi:hypothetical protein